jgi:twinkle protein
MRRAVWLGITRPEPSRDVTPSYTRPPKPKCTEPRGKVHDYLTEAGTFPMPC